MGALHFEDAIFAGPIQMQPLIKTALLLEVVYAVLVVGNQFAS